MTTKYVVITRSEDESKPFATELTKLGLQPFFLPTTQQIPNLTKSELENYFTKLDSYDWLIFTSSKGVTFFMEALKQQKVKSTVLAKLKVATVGEKTAKTAKHYKLNVDFTPPEFTSEALATEFPPVKGKKVLIPRSAIGNPELATHLEEKGAKVTDMPLYTTVTKRLNMEEFWKLVADKQVVALTFASPSAVTGLVENADNKLDDLLSIPVISIGPVTTATLGNYRFNHIYTATPHTTEGMITKIQESIL